MSGLIPSPGDVPVWDGTKFVYAPLPQPIPGPRGKGGGCGMPGPAGPAGPPGPAGDSLLIQEVYGEEQTRPLVYTQPAPGGVFQTVLTVPIVTTVGTYLAITAYLSALTDGGVNGGPTNTEASIRVLVDGVSSGLGDTQSSVFIPNVEPFAALSIQLRFPLSPAVLAPGPHTVELQWTLRGDGSDDKLIGFLVVDQDGCSMFVREMVGP